MGGTFIPAGVVPLLAPLVIPEEERTLGSSLLPPAGQALGCGRGPPVFVQLCQGAEPTWLQIASQTLPSGFY